jgi:alpha-amylase/alpha-mannosidase (GH57 family)
MARMDWSKAGPRQKLSEDRDTYARRSAGPILIYNPKHKSVLAQSGSRWVPIPHKMLGEDTLSIRGKKYRFTTLTQSGNYRLQHLNELLK